MRRAAFIKATIIAPLVCLIKPPAKGERVCSGEYPEDGGAFSDSPAPLMGRDPFLRVRGYTAEGHYREEFLGTGETSQYSYTRLV